MSLPCNGGSLFWLDINKVNFLQSFNTTVGDGDEQGIRTNECKAHWINLCRQARHTLRVLHSPESRFDSWRLQLGDNIVLRKEIWRVKVGFYIYLIVQT